MTETIKPLLIKRYASWCLYNTESSNYVTGHNIVGLIWSGHDVQIIDLKSSKNWTR